MAILTNFNSRNRPYFDKVIPFDLRKLRRVIWNSNFEPVKKITNYYSEALKRGSKWPLIMCLIHSDTVTVSHVFVAKIYSVSKIFPLNIIMLILVSISMGWALGATCCHFQFLEILTYVYHKYRGGPIMPAILVVIGTKYACNLDYKGDQLCLQSWLRWGLNMPAISVWMRTKYACNLGSKGDKICLQ